MNFLCLHCGHNQAQVVYEIPTVFNIQVIDGQITENNRNELPVEDGRLQPDYICANCHEKIIGIHTHQQFLQYLQNLEKFRKILIDFLNGNDNKAMPYQMMHRKLHEMFFSWNSNQS